MFKMKDVIFKDVLSIKELHIEKNKITSIIGPSGSGKSTLLKMFNLMLSPDQGMITYQDDPVESLTPNIHRRKVMMLSQTPYVYKGNVKDNLIVGFSYKEETIPSDDDLRTVLNKVRLSKQLGDETIHFSGGEKQRLALARLLIMNPDVLLLDEPSSALDKALEEEIISILKNELNNQNLTIVLVTHNTDIAYKYSDKIVSLTQGQIEKVEVM